MKEEEKKEKFRTFLVLGPIILRKYDKSIKIIFKFIYI